MYAFSDGMDLRDPVRGVRMPRNRMFATLFPCRTLSRGPDHHDTLWISGTRHFQFRHNLHPASTPKPQCRYLQGRRVRSQPGQHFGQPADGTTEGKYSQSHLDLRSALLTVGLRVQATEYNSRPPKLSAVLQALLSVNALEGLGLLISMKHPLLK